MAGVKISALPAAAASALTDVFPAVQGGVTYKETLQQVLTLFNSNIQIAESQVTNLLTDLANRLQLAGGTMTGNLILNADPVAALGAATKQYVDSVAEGLHFQASCVAATTANLAGYVYANGTAGVGATLTAGGNGAFSTDGVSPALNARILVAFQTAQEENGIYTLTQVGDAGNPAILTRATDYDTPSEIDVGDAVLIQSGTLYTGTLWFQTATVTTIGTDPIVFSLTNSAANIVAGTGLTKTGNTIDLDVPVAASLGGTGVNNGANTLTLGGNMSTGGAVSITSTLTLPAAFSMVGAFTFAGTVTGNTAVTFPTSGTLATLDDLVVKNRVSTSSGAAATGTTVIPFDDSIPQQTEGDEYMTLSITPQDAANILVIEVSFNCAHSAGGVQVVALFRDAGADALCVSADAVAANFLHNTSLLHVVSAGAAAATTFKVRAGSDQAGTLTFNGVGGTRRYGGVLCSGIQITEYGV